MKKILFSLLILSSIIYSCDVIEGPYDEQVTVDTTNNRKILLEDFTGHQCGNCPCAAREAVLLDSIFEGRVIVVATHIGFFARTNSSGKFSYDFTTTTGDQLDNYFQIDAVGLPRGMVNRDTVNSSRILNPSAWASAIGQLINKPQEIDIKINKTYNESSRAVNASIDVNYLSSGNANHNLVLYVVEDSIVNWQLFYAQCGTAGEFPDYVHRHVLRGAVNSTWGDALVASGTIAEGTKITKTYNTTLDNSWNDKHIYLVAFVHDNITKKVIQAEEIKLK